MKIQETDFYLENNKGNAKSVASGARFLLFQTVFKMFNYSCICLSYINIIWGSLLWKINIFRLLLGIMVALK